MAEYATYRGRGGGLHRFKLPLSPAFAEQVAKGYLVLVDDMPAVPVHKPIVVVGQHVVPNPIKSVEEAKALADDMLDMVKGAADEVHISVSRPSHADAKAKWVAYAVAQGMAEADAKAMTKAELVDKYGH
jgi:hypothetical protein